jgi:hypothetical protein
MMGTIANGFTEDWKGDERISVRFMRSMMGDRSYWLKVTLIGSCRY